MFTADSVRLILTSLDSNPSKRLFTVASSLETDAQQWQELVSLLDKIESFCNRSVVSFNCTYYYCTVICRYQEQLGVF